MNNAYLNFSLNTAKIAVLSVFGVLLFAPLAQADDVPTCNGKPANIYVKDGKIVHPHPWYNGKPATAVIRGTKGNDVFVGNEEANKFYGGRGKDTICGLGGDDDLRGERGHDYIEGGEGNDILLGGRGKDELYGQGGDDGVYGGPGNDTMRGGDGDDAMAGWNGNDFICGDAGNDYIKGQKGKDTLCGGEGDDDLRGGRGRDKIDGGPGTDVILGQQGKDTCSAETMWQCETEAVTPECGDHDDGDDGEDAHFYIAEKDLKAFDTAVENQKDITLYRFEARAEGNDLLHTKLVFEAVEGHLNNASNYTWWVDVDDDGDVDTILEDGVASQNGLVTFVDAAGGGFAIPEDGTALYEIRADVASDLTSDKLKLQLATGVNHYVEVEDLDDGDNLNGIETNGSCPVDTCRIHVSTTGKATLWTLTSNGNLYVTLDSTPIQRNQVLGGTLSEILFQTEFRAEVEDIEVTDIQLTVLGDINSIKRAELYLDGESDWAALGTIGGCGSDDVPAPGNTLCFNMEDGQLIVPKNTDVTGHFRFLMKSDIEGGVSGEQFNLEIDPGTVINESTGEGAIRAYGWDSANALLGNDEDTTAEGEVFIGTDVPGPNAAVTDSSNGPHTVVMAKIVSIINANPDANGDPIPLGLSDIGAFKFTAAAHGNSKDGDNDVVFDGIVFNVNATNVAIDASSFALYNSAVPSTAVSCTPYDAVTGAEVTGTATDSLLILCENLETSSVDTEIDEGDDINLVLQATVTDANTSTEGMPSTLQVSMQQFDDPSYTSFGIGAGDGHVFWKDIDGGTNESYYWIQYPSTTVKSTSYSG